jgi:hypothetical protein
MNLIDDWIRMLHTSGLNENTVQAYCRDIRRIESSLDGVKVEDAKPEQLMLAFNILNLEGMSTSSLKRMQCGLNRFLYFLEEQHLPNATAPGHNLLPTNSSPFPMGRQAKRTSSPRSYKAYKYPQLADPLYLRERYLTLLMGTEEISTEVGCTKQAVFKALRAHGIETRSHSQAWWASAEKDHTKTTATPINEAFFSKWSPAAAYVFGVILTDGNLKLSKSPDGSVRFGSGCVSISQKEPEILNKVGALIGHSGKITFQPRREYQGRVAGELYTLKFSSDRVVADLVCLGLRPRKSLTLQFPDMPVDMRRHFIRNSLVLAPT